MSNSFINKDYVHDNTMVRAWASNSKDTLFSTVLQDMIDDNGSLTEGWLVSAKISTKQLKYKPLQILLDSKDPSGLDILVDEAVAQYAYPKNNKPLGLLSTYSKKPPKPDIKNADQNEIKTKQHSVSNVNVITEIEANQNADYYRTLYQQGIWNGMEAEAIAKIVNLSSEKVSHDLLRIKKTLHYSSQAKFIMNIDGLRGFKIKLGN